MVVYVGDELGPEVLLSVASRFMVDELGLMMFVKELLLPAVDVVRSPVNRNRQFDDVPVSVMVCA